MANHREVRYETTPEGCMLVVSHKLNKDGYFRKMTKEGRAVMYHRLVWEWVHGGVPKGFEVHHTCHNRNCINLKHLQLLPVSEHKALTNTERTVARREAAHQHWLETKCTGTHLAKLFGVSWSAACKWIREWEGAETIRKE